MEKTSEQAPVRTRILIVDDDPLVLTVCEKILNDVADVVFAKTANEAMDRLDEGFFDTVLTDLQMPSIDGLDLCAAISTLFPQTRCLVMTGSLPEDPRHVRAVKRGFAVLTKPFTVEQMREFALTDAPVLHPAVF